LVSGMYSRAEANWKCCAIIHHPSSISD